MSVIRRVILQLPMILAIYLFIGFHVGTHLDYKIKLANLSPAGEAIYQGISYRNIETVEVVRYLEELNKFYPWLYEL